MPASAGYESIKFREQVRDRRSRRQIKSDFTACRQFPSIGKRTALSVAWRTALVQAECAGRIFSFRRTPMHGRLR